MSTARKVHLGRRQVDMLRYAHGQPHVVLPPKGEERKVIESLIRKRMLAPLGNGGAYTLTAGAVLLIEDHHNKV